MTKLYSNGADLKLISKLAAAVLRVSLDQIRLCPSEIGAPTATEASQDETSILDAKEDETNNQTTQHNKVHQLDHPKVCGLAGSGTEGSDSSTLSMRTLLFLGQGHVVIS